MDGKENVYRTQYLSYGTLVKTDIHERKERLDMPTLLSIPKACADLGDISRTTLWELANEGLVERVHIGRRAFITSKSIAAYCDSLSGSVDDPADEQRRRVG